MPLHTALRIWILDWTNEGQGIPLHTPLEVNLIARCSTAYKNQQQPTAISFIQENNGCIFHKYCLYLNISITSFYMPSVCNSASKAVSLFI